MRDGEPIRWGREVLQRHVQDARQSLEHGMMVPP
jgi:hypothetical protein